MEASYTKLRSGDWGIRVRGAVEAGAVVEVTKKSGETKRETVERVLWSGDGVALCAIAKRQAYGFENRRDPAQPRSSRTCPTCGQWTAVASGGSCTGHNAEP